MENACVVGYGVVGKATAHALNITAIFDPDLGYADLPHTDYYFICVPTPTFLGRQDLDAIKQALSVISVDGAKAVIVRSTILPGTTNELEKEFKVKILHMPEFLSEATAFEDAANPEFVFLGGNDIQVRNEVAIAITQELGLPVIQVKPETAELVKYAMNTFFGMKVVLGNILWDIAKDTKADYWKVQEALEQHKWGSLNGWNPFHSPIRGFGGKCLPKDIEALSTLDRTGLLKKLLEVNDGFRQV